MKNDIPAKPTDLFYEWFHRAEKTEASYASAMNLATVSPEGKAQVRVVLMRDLNEDGVFFYTNYDSDKGRALIANPYAEVNFHWKSQEKQIRIAGRVEKMSAETSDIYFNNRPRPSRVGAWASDQSKPLGRYEDFEKRIAEFEKKFDGVENPPRPAHWGGFQIIPDKYEFWEEMPYRLHKRFIYTRDNANDDWQVTWLYP